MKATVMDMRRNPKKILDAIKRNERVTLSMRGNEIAEIVPIKRSNAEPSIVNDPAIGIWADRSDIADPSEYIRILRKGRFNVI